MPIESPKPHREYDELVSLLISRGMMVLDKDYAIKKLSQVGYYRLSGYWYAARKVENQSFIDKFLDDVDFKQVYKLYLFDKKLRLLLLDIIERLEINIRNIMAHELGRENPLAYQDSNLINPKFVEPPSKYHSSYEKWLESVANKISRSHDDCIVWHRNHDKALPFWVIVETWDFGTLSKYYSILKGQYQQKIARVFQIHENILTNWLREINTIRNLSAHHSRVWNRSFSEINIPDFTSPKLSKFKHANSYFSKFDLNEFSKTRLFSRIVILWYLINQTSNHYDDWLNQLKSLIQEFPDIPNVRLKSMGLMDKQFLNFMYLYFNLK